MQFLISFTALCGCVLGVKVDGGSGWFETLALSLGVFVTIDRECFFLFDAGKHG